MLTNAETIWAVRFMGLNHLWTRQQDAEDFYSANQGPEDFATPVVEIPPGQWTMIHHLDRGRNVTWRTKK